MSILKPGTSEVLDVLDSAISLPSRGFIRHREKRLNISPEETTHVHLTTVRGETLNGRIINISRFGARVELLTQNALVEIGEEVTNFNVSVGSTVVFHGAATIVSQIPVSETSTHYGLALKGDGVDLEQVNAILQIQTNEKEKNHIGSVKGILDLAEHIKPEFKALIADLNTLLQDLKLKLNQEELRIKELAASETHRKRLEEHTINLAIALYREDAHKIFDKFSKLVRDLDNDSTVIHKRYFRANFHPSILGTPFVQRSWLKPLGHAGDYGLMVMLYEYDDIGTTLFDKFFHRFCCNEPAAVANKNRVELLSDLISVEYRERSKGENKRFKISSIACGPAKEIELFLSEVAVPDGHSIHATCLDQEGEALDYAIQRIRKITGKKKSITSSFLKEDAIMGLIRKKAFTEEIANSNVITCAGMYDYVSDRLASKLIGCMYEFLAPGGLLLVGNVSDQNPDRFSMDYFLEWNLILRSPEDLKKLVPENILNDPKAKVDVISEPLGLNLFLTIRKPDER